MVDLIVLFDYGRMDMPLNDSAHAIFIIFKVLPLQISYWSDIFNTFKEVVC